MRFFGRGGRKPPPTTLGDPVAAPMQEAERKINELQQQKNSPLEEELRKVGYTPNQSTLADTRKPERFILHMLTKVALGAHNAYNSEEDIRSLKSILMGNKTFMSEVKKAAEDYKRAGNEFKKKYEKPLGWIGNIEHNRAHKVTKNFMRANMRWGADSASPDAYNLNIKYRGIDWTPAFFAKYPDLKKGVQIMMNANVEQVKALREKIMKSS
tara:strand:- start:343 stop:978 length:636 start_codon:yes stop_codon:yes gene_type:complete